jgi:hypothetical protein
VPVAVPVAAIASHHQLTTSALPVWRISNNDIDARASVRFADASTTRNMQSAVVVNNSLPEAVAETIGDAGVQPTSKDRNRSAQKRVQGRENIAFDLVMTALQKLEAKLSTREIAMVRTEEGNLLPEELKPLIKRGADEANKICDKPAKWKTAVRIVATLE